MTTNDEPLTIDTATSKALDKLEDIACDVGERACRVSVLRDIRRDAEAEILRLIHNAYAAGRLVGKSEATS